MSVKIDDEGRLPIPESIRETYGDRYHIVPYQDRISLVPIDDEPLAEVREAAGDLQNYSIEWILADIDRIAAQRGERPDADEK